MVADSKDISLYTDYPKDLFFPVLRKDFEQLLYFSVGYALYRSEKNLTPVELSIKYSETECIINIKNFSKRISEESLDNLFYFSFDDVGDIHRQSPNLAMIEALTQRYQGSVDYIQNDKANIMSIKLTRK